MGSLVGKGSIRSGSGRRGVFIRLSDPFGLARVARVRSRDGADMASSLFRHALVMHFAQCYGVLPFMFFTLDKEISV